MKLADDDLNYVKLVYLNHIHVQLEDSGSNWHIHVNGRSIGYTSVSYEDGTIYL